MKRSIATELGLMMARFEHSIYHAGDADVETYQKIALISETCRNFAQAGDTNFCLAFDKAYQEEIIELETTPLHFEQEREHNACMSNLNIGVAPNP